MKNLILLFAVVIVNSVHCLGQEWRGIELLRSTCDNVKQVLKVEKCEYPKSQYDLPDEIVTVTYSSCPCPSFCSEPYEAWNVPRGTVLSIRREIRNPSPPLEFDVHSPRWSKTYTDMIGHIVLFDRERGITLSTIDGNLASIIYSPAPGKSEQFRCPKCSTGVVPSKVQNAPSSWIIAYGDISFSEEKTFLDKFGVQLSQKLHNSKGYIVVYSDCSAASETIQKRAQSARDYVVSTYGIPSSEIVIIDGGKLAALDIQLHIKDRKLPAPEGSVMSFPRK